MNTGINRGMSKERRANKKARHESNRELRATLHRQKAFAKSMQGRAEVQSRIDLIGAGKQE